MAGLCGGSRCGCAITGGAISGSGSAADPYVVSGAAGVVGYAQVTEDQTGIMTIADLTGLAVTFTAVAGRRYKVTGHVNLIAIGATVSEARLSLRAGSTVLGSSYRSSVITWARTVVPLSYSNNASISGSRTWKLSLDNGGSSNSLALKASSTSPGFLLVEDIGEL